MPLPLTLFLQVDQSKITDYLLSTSHPEGASKAEFFKRFGFSLENWATFADALKEHGWSGEILRVAESDAGTKYTVEGTLTTPDGRTPRIYTIWIFEPGAAGPRLVTAFPSRRYKNDQGT